MEWNKNFGMEYERCQNGMEWKISRTEWKAIFHTNSILYFVHCIYRKKYIWMSGNDAYCLSTDCSTLVVCITQAVYLLHHSKYTAISSINVIVDDFDRFDLFFFILRLTICEVVNLFFFHRSENPYLLFHSHFSLILFIFLSFKLIIIVFGVKAWYFYCGKCSVAVWLSPIL